MYRCFQMLIHLFTVTLVKVDITVHLYFTDEKLKARTIKCHGSIFLRAEIPALQPRSETCSVSLPTLPTSPPLPSLAYHWVSPHF